MTDKKKLTREEKSQQDYENANKMITVQYRGSRKATWKDVARFRTHKEAKRALPKLRKEQRKKEQERAVKENAPLRVGEWQILAATTVSVFKYGLAPLKDPETGKVANLDDVFDQLHAAHVFRNNLTAIDREARRAYRELRLTIPAFRKASKKYDKALAAYKTAQDEISTVRQHARTRSAETSTMTTKAEKLHKELKAVGKELKKARKAADAHPKVKGPMKKINVKAEEDRKAARHLAKDEHDLFWATYNLQSKAAGQARSGVRDPKFHSWLGTGRVGAQFQYLQDSNQFTPGLPITHVWGGDTRFEIDPVDLEVDSEDPRRWDRSVPRCERKRRCRTRMHLHIATVKERDENGKVQKNEKGKVSTRKVWAEFQIALHRPLPNDGVLKAAVITRQRIGLDKVKWRLHLTVKRLARPLSERPGVVGVDIGWRLLPNGFVRVGYWSGDDGESNEILLPPQTWHRVPRIGKKKSARGKKKSEERGQLAKADELRSLRDELFNKAKKDLRAWIVACKEAEEHLPGWLVKETENLHSWKAQRRLAKLVLHWKTNRFEGDAKIFNRLEGRRVLRSGVTKKDTLKSKLTRQEGNLFGAACRLEDAKQHAGARQLLAKQPRLLARLEKRPETKGQKPVHYYRYQGWRKQDKHLYNWEANARENGLLVRREAYRLIAAQLARRYGTVIINVLNLKQAAQRATTEEEEKLFAPARLQRTRAAPSHLVTAFKNACRTHGTFYIEQRIVGNCHACGSKEKWNNAEELRHECSQCGVSWDQDYNTAVNARKLNAVLTGPKRRKAA